MRTCSWEIRASTATRWRPCTSATITGSTRAGLRGPARIHLYRADSIRQRHYHLQLLYITPQSGCLGGRKRSGQPFGDSATKGWHANFSNPGNADFALGGGSWPSVRVLTCSRAASPPENVFAIMQNTWGIAPVDFNGTPGRHPAHGTWEHSTAARPRLTVYPR